MEKYENLTAIIAENLVYYRKKAQMTQLELAEKLSYSDKSISKWERGDGVPDIHILVQLAKLYGLTVNDFLTTRKKEKVANFFMPKVLITLMSIGLVWFVATVVFSFIKLIAPNSTNVFIENAWLFFIYAIPISFIVLIVFNDVFFKRIYNVLAVSGLIWTLAASVFLTLWIYRLENIGMIFVAVIPLQILVCLFYLLIFKRRKK